MNKLILIPAIALSGLIFNTADAQIGIHLSLGFRPRIVVYAAAPAVAEQPAVYEQPAPVYDQQAPANADTADDYYYLPDVDAYYDVTDQCYFYFNGDNWISAAYLPGAYYNYDWRSARRFEVRAPRPYMHDDFYRSHYNGQSVAEWSHANYDSHAGNGYANQGYRNTQPQMARGGYNQSAQPYRTNSQPAPQNKVNNPRTDNSNKQPVYQNRQQDNRGGAEHFVQNNRPQNNIANRRMSKF
jgi:hypothetical protein